MTEGHTRRLQAILAADVVGYSRLMNRDEEGTLARLQALEREVVDRAISGHDGEIVKRLGDGVLAVFSSAVSALRAARAIHDEAARQQSDLEAPIRYRIGINIGDVIESGNDIFGDGVNIASRLEGLADPGGIALSAAVHDNVRAQDPGPFDDLGERQVKNIEHPVHVYRVRFADSPPLVAASGRSPRWIALAAGGLLLVVALLLVLWLWPGAERPQQATAPEAAPVTGTQATRENGSEAAPDVAEPVAPAPVTPSVETSTTRVPRSTPPSTSTTPSRETTTPAPSSTSAGTEPTFSERLLDNIAEAVEQELSGSRSSTDKPSGKSKVPPGQAKKDKWK